MLLLYSLDSWLTSRLRSVFIHRYKHYYLPLIRSIILPLLHLAILYPYSLITRVWTVCLFSWNGCILLKVNSFINYSVDCSVIMNQRKSYYGSSRSHQPPVALMHAGEEHLSLSEMSHLVFHIIKQITLFKEWPSEPDSSPPKPVFKRRSTK